MYVPRYFAPPEVAGLDDRLVSMLDRARELAGIPFFITCGYRSPEHNSEIGGAANSSHTRGLAVDLRCGDSFSRFLIVRGLLDAGFQRIEVSPKHIHADCDMTLPNPVIFLGPDL